MNDNDRPKLEMTVSGVIAELLKHAESVYGSKPTEHRLHPTVASSNEVMFEAYFDKPDEPGMVSVPSDQVQRWKASELTVAQLEALLSRRDAIDHLPNLYDKVQLLLDTAALANPNPPQEKHVMGYDPAVPGSDRTVITLVPNSLPENNLSDAQKSVLQAIEQLGDNAYGTTITPQVQRQLGVPVFYPLVQARIEDLIDLGLVEAYRKPGDPHQYYRPIRSKDNDPGTEA